MKFSFLATQPIAEIRFRLLKGFDVFWKSHFCSTAQLTRCNTVIYPSTEAIGNGITLMALVMSGRLGFFSHTVKKILLGIASDDWNLWPEAGAGKKGRICLFQNKLMQSFGCLCLMPVEPVHQYVPPSEELHELLNPRWTEAFWISSVDAILVTPTHGNMK